MRIAEIAKAAKVSPATVSRVINQPHLVTPEKLQRVKTAMQELDYVPLPLNRRRGPKSRLAAPRKIGVWFVGTKKNPSLNWFQDQLLQVQPSSEQHRVDLTILFSEQADELPRQLAERQVDGVILQGMQPAAECMEKLRSLPHVWFMTRRTRDYPGDYVEPNNRENGRIAADYLRQRNHPQVALLTIDPEYSAIARRSEAFFDRAQELGLPALPVVSPSTSELNYLELMPMQDRIEKLAEAYARLPSRPTGVYIPTDHFCGALFRVMRKVGLVPGHDFEAILGNYNAVIHSNLDYPPASIDINLPTLVRRVIDQLIWRIDNPVAPGRIGIAVSPTLRTEGSFHHEKPPHAHG